ncbi:MAG TPA: hypothetical protein VMR18_00405 [Candidatus Saccharimonadales bacterium]|nr:hypothetical protein [Candidatus Saccharimonadales bacterium]
MWKKQRPVFVLFAVIGVALCSFALFTGHTLAATGINPELSFEGKIVNTSAGTNIPDATYNMEFHIYTGCTNNTGSGCTSVWTEDELVSASQGVVFKSGTFQVNLGAVTAFGASVPWGTNPLYLSLQIGSTTSCTPAGNFQTNCGGDGVMSPYILLTSTPYAFTATQLVANSGANSSTLQFAAPTGTNTITIPNNTGTVIVSGGDSLGSAVSIGAYDNNALNLITNNETVESLSSSGAAVFQNSSNSSTAFTILNASPSSYAVLTVDTSGNNLILGTSSQISGSLVFDNSNNTQTITITTPTSALTTGYSLTLPSVGPTASQCLRSGSSTPGLLAFGSCGGSVSLQQAYNAGSTISTTANGTVAISASAAPTADIVSISNSGQADTTANANGLHVTYVGGSAAVESSGLRIDFTPGGTSGGTWDGVHIVANTTGPVSGVSEYGLKLDGPTSAGTGTAEAIYVNTGWNIGVDIQSGGIQLAAQSDPSAPAASELKLYAKSVAGDTILEMMNSTDGNLAVQPGLGFNRVSYAEPNGTANCSTGTTGFGSISAGGGTCTAPVPASTNLLTSVRDENYSTGTTAGTVTYQHQDVLQVWRGNAAGYGGWFYEIRFGMNTLQTGNYVFVGLADSVATPTSVDPTTNTTPGKLGLAIDASTGDWNWINNVTGSAPTVTSLGSSFPVNNTDLYELMIYCPPDGSTITYRLTDESSGAQVTNSITTNIPGATTFLAPDFYISNHATAAAAILSFNSWYLQSDN